MMKVNTVTRKFVLVLILSLILPTAVGHATNHKPTLAQIEAAKKAEAAKKKAAADALKRLERARGNLRALTAIAKAADAKYLAARNELPAQPPSQTLRQKFMKRRLHLLLLHTVKSESLRFTHIEPVAD